MKQKENWGVFEEDDYVLIMPLTDIKPHGFPKEGEKEVELAGLDCPCKPKVIGGDKPTIIHNSFEDQKRIDESLEKL